MFSIIKTFFLLIDFQKFRMRKIYVLSIKNINKFNKPKVSYICDQKSLHFSICSKWWSENEKKF